MLRTKTRQKASNRASDDSMAHILVVDDERSICELLEITFRKEGHRVEVATGGEAARRRLQSKIFDIVISDIRMPDDERRGAAQILPRKFHRRRFSC